MNFIDLLMFSYIKPKKEIGKKIFFQIRSYFILYHLAVSPAPSRVPARLLRAFARVAPPPSPPLLRSPLPASPCCRYHGENQHFGAKSMISLILQIFLLNIHVFSPALTSRARGGV